MLEKPIEWPNVAVKEFNRLFLNGEITDEQLFNSPFINNRDVAKRQIEKFCKRCDLYKDEACTLTNGQIHLPIAVTLQKCDKAVCKSQQGTMVNGKFIPKENDNEQDLYTSLPVFTHIMPF